MHIKLPTAKVILSSFRKKGRIFLKKCEEKEIEDFAAEKKEVQDI